MLSIDNTALSDIDTVAITVNPINDAPINSVPGAQTVDENTPLPINAITVTDVDGNLATTQLSVNNGTVTVSLAGLATISSGANGSDTLTISGSEADINATLSSATYQGNLHFNGADVLTIVATNSAGTPISDADTVAITVDPINDTPVNIVPGPQAVDENTQLPINTITVTDVDGNLATTQLSVINGTVTVSLAGSTTISSGANGSNSLTLAGSETTINATLATLIYQGNLNFNGCDVLTVTTTDSAGTLLSNTDTVAIAINPANLAIAPIITITNDGSTRIQLNWPPPSGKLYLQSL